MSITSQTSDVIWNGFGNKEMTDSETSSLSEEGDKRGSLVEKARNAEWRKQDDGYCNRKPNDLPRENETLVYVIYAALP